MPSSNHSTFSLLLSRSICCDGGNASSPKSLKNASSSFASLRKLSSAAVAVFLSVPKSTSNGSSPSISSTAAGAERALNKGCSELPVAFGFANASNSSPKSASFITVPPSSNANALAEDDFFKFTCGEKTSSASAKPPVNGSGASDLSSFDSANGEAPDANSNELVDVVSSAAAVVKLNVSPPVNFDELFNSVFALPTISASSINLAMFFSDCASDSAADRSASSLADSVVAIIASKAYAC